MDQLERYLAAETFPCADPLAYWHARREAGDCPELAQMALDYLSAPGEYISLYHNRIRTDYSTPLATSVDVERAFSAGRRTVSLYRHSLSCKTIQASILFGNRCKEGLVNDAELVEMLFEQRTRGGRPQQDQGDLGSECEDEGGSNVEESNEEGNVVDHS